MEPSKQWNLNSEDWQAQFKKGIIYLAPALVVFLTVLNTGGTIKEASVSLYTWGVSQLLGLAIRWQAGGK